MKTFGYLLFQGIMLIVLCQPRLLAAQPDIPDDLMVKVRSGSLKAVIQDVQTQTDYSFAYGDGVDDEVAIEINPKKITLKNLLLELEKQASVSFHVIGKVINMRISEESDVSTSHQLPDSEVSGKVIDATGEPLIGATVQVKETGTGTLTDLDGGFVLDVPNDGQSYTLEVSYVGYSKKEIKISGDQTYIEIDLSENVSQLNEVVVTALGIKREKKALGYSSQQVDEGALNVGNDPNVINKLSGKVAGVQVTQGSSGAGSSSRVIIRGEASLANNNQPLYVVDGVPITDNIGSEILGTSASVDYGNGAGELNADDIESINVLKGASATALYGSRAANGAIIITTKSGKTKDRVQVDVNSTVTLETVGRLPEYQDGFSQGKNGVFEYWNGRNGLGTEDHQDISWGRELNGDLVTQFDGPSVGPNGELLRGGDVILRNGAPIEPTPLVAQPDNIRDFFETGVTLSNNIAINTSNERSNFRLSYTNLDSKGALPNVDLQRHTISINTGSKLTDWLHAKVNVNYIQSTSDNRPSLGYGSENIMYTFAWWGRQVNINSLKEYWQRGQEGVQQFHFNYAWNDNPYFTMYENTNGFNRNRVFGNIAFNANITENLQFLARVGIDFMDDNREARRAWSTQQFKQGAYKEEDVYSYQQNIDFIMTYDQPLSSAWGLRLTGGANLVKQEDRYNGSFANGLLVPGVYNLGNSASPIQSTDRQSEKKINGIFLSGELSFNNWLYITVTGRNDWSSALTLSDGSGDNSYFYPSISTSAVLSDVMELPSAISYWSMRGGYAEVGNDTDPYRLENGYRYFSRPYESGTGVELQTTLNNSDLKPERLKSYEIGTDIRFFNNRLGLDLSYYNSLNTNQIIQITTSLTSGYVSRFVNSGEIRNYGVEAILTASPIRKRFRWDMNINFAMNRGKVEDIDEDFTYTGAALGSSLTSRTGVFAIAKEGESMGDLYGTDFERVNGKIVVDETGLPVSSNDLVKLGNYNPDFVVGFSNNFSYKGFDLGFLLSWRQGGIFVSRTFGILMESGVLDQTTNRNPEDLVIDGVVFDEESGTYLDNTVQLEPRDYYRSLYRRFQETQLVFSATNIKLRELTLGYTFPKPLIDKWGIDKVRLSLVGRNLWIWSKDQDYVDPEAWSVEGSLLTPGVEEMNAPPLRSYGLNLNLSF